MPKGEIGPPSPVCRRGHRLTAKTARWRTVVSKTKKRYLQVSCRLCESSRFKFYYRNTMKGEQNATAQKHV